MEKKINIRKLTVAAVLVALGVVLSPFSIPVGASKCFPIQHLMNILGAVFLGPVYAVGMAFSTSLIRNLLGTGTLLAFPGSMFGALISGLLYKNFKKLPFAYIGELLGTGIIGAIIAYPVAAFVLGKDVAAFFFVVPFIISSFGGTIIAIVLVTALKKTGVIDNLVNTNKGKL